MQGGSGASASATNTTIAAGRKDSEAEKPTGYQPQASHGDVEELGHNRMSKEEKRKLVDYFIQAVWPENGPDFDEFRAGTSCTGDKVKNAYIQFSKPAFATAWLTYKVTKDMYALQGAVTVIASAAKANMKVHKKKAGKQKSLVDPLSTDKKLK